MENKKNIWFINDYAGTPYIGMEYRHYYLGKELVKLGHKVTVISSAYSHLFKHLPKKSKENIDGIEYHWLRTLHYTNAHDKRRAIKWFLFSFKLIRYLFAKNSPDAIIVSTAAPFAILPSYLLAKRHKAKLIFEVKDIWPLSLIELGGFSKKNPFIKLMLWFEKFALTKSDVIVSNLQNYGEHIKRDVGINRDFEWISNGVDMDELNQIEPLSEDIIKQIPKDKFIIGYAGTVGVANALDSFLESAVLLQDNENIAFVIVGDGQEKKKLMEQVDVYDNIFFIDPIPKKQVQSMLKFFDVCYISARKEKLYRYGVSPNKLFDYMYSKKPILYAIESGKNIVDVADCGISVEAQNSQSITNGILKLYNMSQDKREKLGQNGREYVLKHFTYQKLAEQYESLIYEKGERNELDA